MNYKIIIERKEPNPNFEAELAKWQESNKYNRYESASEYPSDMKITNALICEITEEQFKAIKGNIMEVFY
jgi:hypothetical protein